MKKYLLSILALTICYNINSQQLKRLASDGISGKLVDQEIAKEAGLKEIKGALIRFVNPNSTAGELGVIAGDILLSIDGIALNSYADFSKKELIHYEGDDIEIKIFRNGEIKILKGKSIGNPYETSDEYNIEYGSFEFMGGKIRSIFTKPKTLGKKPAILFIPGYPCQSIDNMDNFNSYKYLVEGLTRKGYIVMRAEKPGLGDSYNTPDCSKIDFPTEVASFRAALKSLLNHPEVDVDNVFVFGHSLGGIEAPFVAKDMNIKGVIAMGITIKLWREYILEAARIQNPNLGTDHIEHEKDIRILDDMLYELLILDKMPSEITKENLDYKRLMASLYGNRGGDNFITRHISFSQTLHKSNLIESWANTTCKVLSVWGESDIQVLNDYSHREMVKIVNFYHPNNATFMVLEDTDHMFLNVPTIEQSYQKKYRWIHKSIIWNWI